MRVCMVAYTFYESDNRVMRYAETLASVGHHVEVIALGRPGADRYETLNGVHVFRIQRRKRNEKHKWNYLLRILSFFLRSTMLVTLHHLRDRYQFVHVHSVPDFLVFAAWCPKVTGTPVALDIHDILPEFYASKFGKNEASLVFKLLLIVERLSAAFADHVIIANDLWYERLTARSVSSHKCTAIINAPDTAIFKTSARPPNSDRAILIYPGTLNRHQGLDIAIHALSLLPRSAPPFELRIYGEGPTKESLIALSHELALDDRVRFYPAQSIREIAGEMAKADLGIVPKRADSFGNQAFSTKILEFMCLGVPVLVSRTAIDSFYFNESVVTFFESGNAADFADRLLILLGDLRKREQQVRNASIFVQKMTWDVYKEHYLHLVQNLTGTGPSEFVPAEGRQPSSQVWSNNKDLILK